MSTQDVKKEKMMLELFIDGCRKGFKIAVEHIMPAMVFAFVLIQILQKTGLMAILGKVMAPVMALWGLPGEASIVLLSAFFAKAAGAGAAASLYNSGMITAAQATILYPAVILMGTLLGHYVRIVVVSGALPKYHPLLIATCLFDAAIGMWITMFFV